MIFSKKSDGVKTFLRVISIILVNTFLLSTVAFAAPQDQAAAAAKEVVTNPDNIVIPRELGLVKSKFNSNTDKLVVHIQDAHCNYEAQSNIAKMLEAMIKNDGLKFVAVEGADGVIDTSWFKAFPDDAVRKEVADYFMKKGEITGPEFLSITTDYPIKLFGAETRAYYIENLNAFTSSYPMKADTESYLNTTKAALEKLKTIIYSDELKLIDAKDAEYEAKKLQFNEYVRFLQSEAEKNKINLREYDNLFKLVNVLIYEKKIDFSVTDKERSDLIDELTKKMSKDGITQLVARSVSFKIGKISAADYYNYLKALAAQHAIDLAREYKNLYNYIIYNSVYSKIENEKLFSDLKAVEVAIKEKLFKNDDQRQLEKLSRHIDTLIGLVNIKLLNGDFDYYKSHKDEFAAGIFADFIHGKAAQYGLAMEILPPAESVANSIAKLEEFYVVAIKRDKALVDNTLAAMNREGQKIAVLVTGGFHSEGIAKLLEKQGVSYVVVCPSITKDVPTPYIQVLTNQRTSFEDIITGVAEPAAAKQGMLAPASIAWAARIDGLDEALRDRVQKDLAEWASDMLSGWMSRAMRAAGDGLHRLAQQEQVMLEAYTMALDYKLSAMVEDEVITPDRAKDIRASILGSEHFRNGFHNAFIAAQVAVARETVTQTAETPRAKPEPTDASSSAPSITLAQAYSSPQAFIEYIRQQIIVLNDRIPQLESMMARYRTMTDKGEKAKLAKEVDDLITQNYNAWMVEQTVGASLEGITSDDIVRDVPTLADFQRDRAGFLEFGLRARELRFEYGRARIDVWAGAASRLFGEGQKVDPKLSYAAHDVYDVALSRGYSRQDLERRGAKFGLSIATRLMLQKWVNTEAELRAYYAARGTPKSEGEIKEKRRELVRQTPRIVVINDESGESVIGQWLNNNFYGHDPELVVFVVQPTYRGFDIRNGVPTLIEESRPFPGGHGDATMQVVEEGRAFTLTPEGVVKPISKNAVEYLMEATEGRIKIWIQSRVNDMIKLGRESDGSTGMSVTEASNGILALALKQMGDLNDIESGRNVVLEQVGQDQESPIKGASPTNVNGKQILVEKLAQSRHVSGVVNIDGVPFNRFFIFYKTVAMMNLKKRGLPVYFRFRDGYIYPETVTGDVTMLDGMNAGYAIDERRMITDYKDGSKPKELANGVEAALGQDENLNFQAHLAELNAASEKVRKAVTGSKAGEIRIKNPEAAPGIDKHAASTGAIRMNGGALTADEHGTRGASADAIRDEASVNGAIAFLIDENHRKRGSDVYGLRFANGMAKDNDYDIPTISLDVSKLSDMQGKNLGKLITALRDMNENFSFTILRGLKKKLEDRKVAPDSIFHPGIGRHAVYLDEKDLIDLLSLSDGVALIMEAVRHELAHINDKNDSSEAEIEKLAPTYNVRLALTMRQAEKGRKLVNVTTKSFKEGQEYEPGKIYRKPLAKFAKFGTSGVRWLVEGILSKFRAESQKKYDFLMSNGYTQEDFNIPNVALVAKAIVLYNLQKAQGVYKTVTDKVSSAEFGKRLEEKGMLVMYDNRPGNERYAKEVARVLAAYGIKATLAKSKEGAYAITPLAAVSLLIKKEGYAGSIYFTASHNGDEWDGIKYNTEDGAPSNLTVTTAIGNILKEELGRAEPSYDIAAETVEELIAKGAVSTVDSTEYYVKAVLDYIGKERVAAIRKAVSDGKVTLKYSAFYGSSSNVMKRIFEELGLPAANIIETQKPSDDVYVESYEPTLEKLRKLSAVIKTAIDSKEAGIILGGAADNDADRFQVNENGEEYPPATLTPILGHYLVKSRGLTDKGLVWGRSFVSSAYQDSAARLFGQSTEQYATGFKYSPNVLAKGGIIYSEESYGLSFNDWTLDKDGILPSILALELVATTGKSLGEYDRSVKAELKARGLPSQFVFERDDVRLPGDVKDKAIAAFKAFFDSIEPGKTVFNGKIVKKRYDPAQYEGGMKFEMEDGSWVALRSSGTEPLIRIYSESTTGIVDSDMLRLASFRLTGIMNHYNKARDIESRVRGYEQVVSARLHTPLAAKSPEMAARFLRGGYKQDGWGVAEGAAVDGSFAIDNEGNQGYYTTAGREAFLSTVDNMKKFFERRERILGKPIKYVIKPGIGGQHTPFQGIAEVFQLIDARTGVVVGEYELGKDYEAALAEVLKANGADWDQIAVIPSSKSGSTDETMIVFSEILYTLLKKEAENRGIVGDIFASTVFKTMHDVNFVNGVEKPGKDLFKGFSLDLIANNLAVAVGSKDHSLVLRQIRSIFGTVLGNMFFETTDRPEASRLSAFIRNSGLDKGLGENAPGFGAMYDNVGGRWTADLHMMTFLAYHGLDAEAYWKSRYEGIKQVRDGTHVANLVADRILAEGITDIALVVPDELFWFGKSVEQNFNESIWQKGFANLIAVKESMWKAQAGNYAGDRKKLVVNLTGIRISKDTFNVADHIFKVADLRALSKQEAAIAMGNLFTTFYGITHVVGNNLIARALAEKGKSPADVDMSDLDNEATKIVQENLYLRQPYVELGKGLLEKRLSALQAEEAKKPGSIDREMKNVQSAAASGQTVASIPDVQIPAKNADIKELALSIQRSMEYAKKTGRKFVPFIYLEGEKFYSLRDELIGMGIEWVMQGTGDQHISYQQVLTQPQRYLPFIVSFVPEKVVEARPAIGFAKGYLNNVSPNMVRDFFAEASYGALTSQGGQGVFMRLTDSLNNRAMFADAAVRALAAEKAKLKQGGESTGAPGAGVTGGRPVSVKKPQAEVPVTASPNDYERLISSDEEVLRSLLIRLRIEPALAKGRTLVLVLDEKLVPRQSAQLVEKVVNRYLGQSKVIVVRGTGSQLLDNLVSSGADKLENVYVVSAVSSGTYNAINAADHRKLGRVIQADPEEGKFISPLALVDAMFKIGYELGEQQILDRLNDIFSREDGERFTAEDLAKLFDVTIQLLKARPIVRINSAEIAEAHKAAQQALQSL
jgi:phosphomannomutase